MKNQQSGFTLIELIMVIVILGILAAVAIPKFVNLGQDARIATLNGALGSARSASAIVHSAALARSISDGDIDVEGGVVSIVNGYPTADGAGIGAAAQLENDFTLAVGEGAEDSVVTISPKNSPVAATCSFTYAAAAAGEVPVFGPLIISGC